MQITNADRCALLEGFRKLAKEWAGDDSTLIAATTTSAAKLRCEFGFECNLVRDILFLGDTLRKTGPSGEVAELARGGLAFLQQNNRIDPLPLGLLDDAFVAGYAALLVREKLGEPARYSPPQLSPEEKVKAEGLFVELLDRSADEDDCLPAKVQETLGQLGHLLESGLFRRLRVNVQFLAGVLRDSGRPVDHRQIARAALHYVSLDNDVIPDHLGLLGFLDDYLIADLAITLIDSDRPPWLNLIDKTIGAWPFLNMVVFEDGQGGVPLSEFFLVNTALVCPDVRGDDQKPITHLILPQTGPLPILLGFLASLGAIWKVWRESGNSVPFQPGQKVLVDGKAVRTFVGCRTNGGRMEFGLGATYRYKKQKLQSIIWWDIDQLYRLAPADNRRAVRGHISAAVSREEPLRALDYLFRSAEPVVIPRDVPQIVVCSPVKTCKETAEAISLFGQRLIDAVPMGHLTPGGEVCPWSSRFGSTRPVVMVIPDLDRACEYVEEEGERVLLTVVDTTGHNAGRTASLTRLGSLGARVLVVTSQLDADESLTEEADSAIWEWKKEDFDSLLSEASHSGLRDQVGPVRRFEAEVVRALCAEVDVVQVQASAVTEAFEAVRGLEELVEARGEEVPPELENALDLSFNVLTRLLRCPFRLSGHLRLLNDLTGKLDSIAGTIAATKAFLTAKEVQAVDLAGSRLRALCELLQRDNPKADALSQIRSSAGSVTVLCGDTDLLEAVDGLVVCPITTSSDLNSHDSDTAYVISGWYGRRRMNSLLRPPFASPLRLILYEIEADWYQAFQQWSNRNTASRQKLSSRSRVFPSIWPEPKKEPEDKILDCESSIVRKTDEDPFESWQSRYLSHRRRRLTASVQPSSGDEAVEARLVLFDGGHAFLTDRYRAKVATHLLGSFSDADEAELKLVPAAQLQHGDLVLFLRGSDRDVLREEADKLLPPGERQRAGLWRDALVDYQSRKRLSIEAVWQDLKSNGCPIGLQAIKNRFEGDVIAPLKYERELETIRKLTEFPALVQQYEACLNAISNVRSAHLRASRQLAHRVLDSAVARLKSSHGGPVDLGDGIVLVRVTGVDESLIRVKATSANRFLIECNQGRESFWIQSNGRCAAS